MAKVYLICGRLCCGKSTYALALKSKNGGVLLSVDEIMLSVFGLYAGEKHDDYVAGVKKYLLSKADELVRAGVNVVLDWGFWTRSEREEVKSFFASRGVEAELHYLDVSEKLWAERIAKRNAQAKAGLVTAYIVDENLTAKFKSRFEAPDRAEADVWVSCG